MNNPRRFNLVISASGNGLALAVLGALLLAVAAEADVTITCPGRKPEVFEYAWEAECVEICADRSWEIRTDDDPWPCRQKNAEYEAMQQATQLPAPPFPTPTHPSDPGPNLAKSPSRNESPETSGNGIATVLLILLVGGGLLLMMRSQSRKKRAGVEAPSRSRIPSRLPQAPISIDVGSGEELLSEARRRVEPDKLARASDRLWVPPGSNTEVANRAILGGMIYVGPSLPPVGGWNDCEPALINPSLKVARSRSDDSGEGLGYWPSYSDIPPESRAAYLDWLSSGRSDPNANIGYVFLFFYGLERRLLFDLRHLPERRGEADALISEVLRLLEIYGDNRSFRGYGMSLLHTARAIWGSGRAYARRPAFSRGGQTLPADTRLALGQLVADGKPIPAEWALAWVMGDPDTRLRTPAHRCPKEFEQLFIRRFEDAFPSGMPLKPNKRRLRLSHGPASASFGGSVDVPIMDVPDVSTLPRPLRPLREIAEAAMEELEGYSRLIGRSPEKASSLEALALLPHELATSRQTPESERLQHWIEEQLAGKEAAVISGADLMTHWNCSRPDRMSKSEVGAFARMLSSFSYGLEPDPRLGGGGARSGEKLVIFKLGPDRVSAGSSGYRVATLLLRVATIVASSDGDVSEEEERHLEENLEQSMHLTDAEARRLRAHLQWLLAEKPRLSGIRKQLDGTDERRRHTLAEFAVATAAVDGVIDPEEVKTLTKIYRTLGLDPEQVYGDIHSLQTGATIRPAESPITVRPATDADAGFVIPERPRSEVKSPGGTYQLDMDRVRQTIADTEAVAAVLAGVFAEEEEPPPLGLSLAPDTIPGLDAGHTTLLRALTGRTELSRSEFEELAESFGLFSDGAYETLNNVAFELVDGPLLEGEDPVEVDQSILTEISA